MILSTGMRTDIPAYYSDWFIKRLNQGFILRREFNDYHLIKRFDISDTSLKMIYIYSRNPQPLLEKYERWPHDKTLWSFAISPYGSEIEPAAPPINEAVRIFKKIVRLEGSESVMWRYDPVFLTEKYSIDFHKAAFARLAHNLAGYAKTVNVRFLEKTPRIFKSFPSCIELSETERIELIKEFERVAERYNIRMNICRPEHLPRRMIYGCGSCLSADVVQRFMGYRAMNVDGFPKCADCTMGDIISNYNTCGHGCIYCNMNYDKRIIRENFRKHDPESPLLIGNISRKDKIICDREILLNYI